MLPPGENYLSSVLQQEQVRDALGHARTRGVDVTEGRHSIDYRTGVVALGRGTVLHFLELQTEPNHEVTRTTGAASDARNYHKLAKAFQAAECPYEIVKS